MRFSERGFVYLWALFAVALAGIVMAGTAQMWQTKSQRQKEAELMFIGEEFRKAIMSYHNTGTKQFPTSLEDLLKDERLPNVKRHIRKIYLDPITNTAEWGLVEEAPPNTSQSSTQRSGSSSSSSNTGSNNSSTAANKNSNSSNQSGSGTAASNNTLTPNSNTSANANPASATANNPVTGDNSTATASANNSPSTSTSGMSSGMGKRIVGVYSLSQRKPIKKDRFPEQYSKFNEAVTFQDWQFIYKPGDNKGGANSGSASKQAPKSGAGNSPFSPQSSSNSNSNSGAGSSPFSSKSSSGATGAGAGASSGASGSGTGLGAGFSSDD